MPSYQEEIAQLRQEAAERQIENTQAEVRRLRDEVLEAERLALEADQSGDMDTALSYAEWANTAEQQYIAAASQLPQQGQQIEPWVAELARQNQAFLDRNGQAGVQALLMTDGYATRPRTNSNNPAVHGMGLTRGTPEYYSNTKNLLRLYAKDHGLHYDENENDLTPDEAARISGVSAKVYNEGVRKMYAEGRDSVSEQGALWDRSVG